MTLQQLEYIVAVDKYRHFVKAAESCKVTQSTLSSMIQKLEMELDVTIFDRNSHPIKPTLVGEEIIRQAKVILYNSSQLKELTLTEKEKESGEIRLGIISTIAPYILPKLIKFLGRDYPGIKLNIQEDRMEEIVKKLEIAELDVAIMATPLHNDELLEIPIYKENFVAYVSARDRLAKFPFLNAGALPTDKIWVLQEGYCPNNSTLDFWKKEDGNSTSYEAGSIETLIKIVDENGGYTIIPELHVPLLRKCQQDQIKKISNPEPAREVSLVVRKDYVREKILNILSRTIQQIIPEHMIVERVKKFPIKL